MNVLIIGATRGIGFELLKRALERGHAVTALARNPDKIPEQHGRLKVFKGDILDFESVKRATLDQDAVCCCIGTGVTRKLVTVFSQGTKHVLDAMREADVRRLICITGVGAGNSKNHGGFL
jgi:putative NADH-flavin reductase